ncbi:SusC/RagA family TonB-linked outer membrane protein [Dysgonomonas sp. Marseille-P4677]|nr:SusC/RagA family TonB-linked outer membrane protein [Dysgonomonas sp. Marseille-P4677]
MRLFFIFMCVSVGLIQASNSYAQNAILDINVKNQTVENVLKQIENQSEFTFFYNTKQIDIDRKVSISAFQKDIFAVLAEIFLGTDVAYSVLDKSIILSSKQNTILLSDGLGIKQDGGKTVSGQIKDIQGEPLIGVSISVKGTTIGTLSDIDGKFSLKTKEGQTIVISLVGYASKEIVIGSQSTIDIVLEERNIALDAVVVTALGIKRSEKALSYNAQEVGAGDLTTVKDANLMNSLVGKVAGVNINSSSTGIGGATKVVIRGSKSIERDNNVLYVIDGIPMTNFTKGSITEGEGIYSLQPAGGEGISDINPDDIESMTVLTGPAAAALYGSSAANGAIVITTKKGQVGKAKVVVSNQTTFMSPFVMPEFQNRYGNAPGTYQSWGDRLAIPSSYDPKDFFNTGSNVQNSVSLSVGNEKNQTYASAGSTNADGIMPNNEYTRYNFSFRNTTSFLNDKMMLDFSANYILQKNQNMTAQGQYFNPLVAVYTYPRGEDFERVRMYEEYNSGREIYTQRWQWGDEGLTLQNPYWTAYRNIFSTKRNRYMMNASLKYDVFDWMNVAGRIKIDNTQSTEEKKLYASTMTLLAGKNGSYFRNNMHEKQTYADIMVNINKYFGSDYSLSANVGASLYNLNYDENGLNGNLYDMPNFFALRNINRADPKTKVLEDGWQQQTQAIFANVELGWKSMLYLTLTGRNDWDSALALMPDKSFFYPSVGLSGVISEMVKLPSFINYMKVRGSYASVGNSIPRNLSIHHYPFDEGTNSWATNTYMPLGYLYPERTKSWEAGLNVKFWKNKFDLNVTLYKSNTYDQTVTVPISASSGYSSIIAQTGNIQNKGLEASLNFYEKWNNFSWSSGFTISANRNKIIDLGKYTNENGVVTELDQIKKTQIGSSLLMLTTGGTLGDLWTTTEIKKDENGNIWVDPITGGISSEDKLQKVGSVLPKWNMGFRNSFAWKDLNFEFVIAARLGGKVVSYTQAVLDAYGVSEVSAVARDNGGIPVNNGFVDAETWYKTVGGTGGIYSHYIYNATNVRLQEASIGYTFPAKWFNNKIKMSASLVGRNLLMIYNKAPFDPESTASTSNYYQGLDYMMSPSLRSYGFNVKFEF